MDKLKNDLIELLENRIRILQAEKENEYLDNKLKEEKQESIELLEKILKALGKEIPPIRIILNCDCGLTGGCEKCNPFMFYSGKDILKSLGDISKEDCDYYEKLTPNKS